MLRVSRLGDRLEKLIEQAASLIFSNHRFSPESQEEIERAAELRRSAIAIINARKKTEEALDIWKQALHDIERHILSLDSRNFLRWPSLSYMRMSRKYNAYIKFALKDLKHSSVWEQTWQPLLREPHIGAPERFYLYPKSSRTNIHHTYLLAQMEQVFAFSWNSIGFCLEFGGGYGNLCRLIHKRGFKGVYTIFDFPTISALQEYYLGLNNLHLINDASIQENRPQGIRCLSDHEHLQDVLNSNVEGDAIFIATWSISEAPLPVRSRIFSFVHKFKYLFIAYRANMETEGVTNQQYFEELMAKNKDHFEWQTKTIKHFPDDLGQSFILLGKRKN